LLDLLPKARAVADVEKLPAPTDPANYLGAAHAMADRVLAVR
jgi:hypothetical protein